METLSTIETDFAEFVLLPSIIILRCHEGVKLGLDHVTAIQGVIDRMRELEQTAIGWISDKVNSYSTDPLIVPPVQEANPNIRSWCNVIYGRKIADYKLLFKAVSKDNFGINSFDTLPTAIKWTYEYLKSCRQESCDPAK
ncbi:hypothetical protein [Pelagicoccus sp. SDUM812002]|uniref:hypothetical protein n=1 Tax=Pelagicoccus sp. SDUM812002 TaxID=3041266 RepID=UPI00280E71FD|nr:hypothetical protein [Pelagicoccus sp. SDUM812002]MDQ8187147.1 hypothetical protein [Pelagicoccus sp. SDUM812002]